MPIPVRSIPTRAGGQSLSTGKSMEPDMHGREEAEPAPTPIREDRTPRGRCCASSSSTRCPRPRREGRQDAPHWATVLDHHLLLGRDPTKRIIWKVARIDGHHFGFSYQLETASKNSHSKLQHLLSGTFNVPALVLFHPLREPGCLKRAEQYDLPGVVGLLLLLMASRARKPTTSCGLELIPDRL